jgi:hypothetical protein
MELKNIGIDTEKLVKARGEQKGAEVARALGIHRQRLYTYEKGTVLIPGNILVRLCLYYDIDARDLAKEF